ncbi:MAG: ISAs1 family transposase, partial [Thermomicrobiales bacterium]|nr:ISAs1 family transposase [Thermomicrobiales bacterium]
MDTPLPHALFVELETLSDPRSPHRRQHKLVDLVTIALCAVLSGADSWVDVAEWGRSKEPWLRTFLELPAGIASHDTFSRLFRLLDPQALEAVLLDWVR